MTDSQRKARAQTTIDDVARRAGVSKSAVSFALNGRPGVSDSTRRRILAAAAELDWQPSPGAKGLSLGRTYAIGLIVAQPPEAIGNDPFFGLLLAGLELVLAPLGYVVVLSAVTDQSEALAYERLIAPRRVDGFVVTNLRRDDPRIGLLADHAMAAVLVGFPEVPGPLASSLQGDDQPGVEAVIDHLIGLGHRRIAHVGGPPDLLHAVVRREAFDASLIRRHLPAGRVVDGGWTSDGGAAATARLLGKPDPPTAIVYANDLMAVGGVAAARSAGRRVPGDLSVVGFDDIPLAAHLSPALTTVQQDPTVVGRLAATALIDLIERRSGPQLVTLPEPRLVVRSSTAPAPT
jgi:DNA-binding LacI/PurR family transcriptional regulator